MMFVSWLPLLGLMEWSRHSAVDVIHRYSLLELLSELEAISKELEAKVSLDRSMGP